MNAAAVPQTKKVRTDEREVAVDGEVFFNFLLAFVVAIIVVVSVISNSISFLLPFRGPNVNTVGFRFVADSHRFDPIGRTLCVLVSSLSHHDH